METVDLAVIGGGSAGYSGAAVAAGLGLKTVCFEGGAEIGGLCILRGCMPSKAIIESANRFSTLRRAEEFGLTAGSIGFDAHAIYKRKRRLIAEFQSYRAQNLEHGKFRFVRGHAELVERDKLRVVTEGAPEQIFTAKTVLLATGSEVNWIEIPGLAEAGCLSSDDALDLDRVPRSIIILGGGAIAIEFAHFYNALGAEVTMLQRSGLIGREFDRDISEAIREALEKRGVKVVCSTKLHAAERSTTGKRVRFECNGEKHSAEAEEILYALGRRAAVQGLNLSAAGIQLDGHRVQVSETMQTTSPMVFAAGDVCGPFEVVHLGVAQGALAARNAAHYLRQEELEQINYRLKTYCIFSEPQVASVGMTEREAEQAGVPIRVAKHYFNDHGKAIVRGETEGFVKLICRADSGEILGAAAIGAEASDLIHEIVVAMYFHATAAQLNEVPHYHPTLSEIWTYPAEELAGLGSHAG